MLVLSLAGCLSTTPDPERHPLIGRKVIYAAVPDAEGKTGRPDIQTWNADGTTLFITDNWLFPLLRDRMAGVWSLEGDIYCRSFEEGLTSISQAERPLCYRMTVIDGGRGLRFDKIGGGFGRDVWSGSYRN